MSDSQISLLPRLQGDGMDSEALRKQEYTKSDYTPKRVRHGNLASSAHTTTILKSKSPSYVPKEPVKGAVKPVTKNNIGHGAAVVQQHLTPPLQIQPQKFSDKNFNIDKYLAESEKALKQVPSKIYNKKLPKQVSSVISVSDQSRNEIEKVKHIVKTVQVPVYNAPSHLKMSTYETIQRQQKEGMLLLGLDNRSKGDNMDQNMKKESVSIGLRSVQEMNPGSSDSGDDGLAGVKLDLAVNALEKLRFTEGNVESNEVESLKKQLEAQIQVNADLKKLLVASMGDELHYTVERLVMDRVHLSEKIGGYTRKMYQDHEDLDKLAIQADMWRTKYMASRVMVDKLSTLRDELSHHVQLSQHALYQCMQERHQLRDFLLQIHRHLRQLKEAFDPNSARKFSTQPASVLDLARHDLQLSDSIKFRLLGPIELAQEPWDRVGHDALTSAEQLACMLLSNVAVSEESKSWLASCNGKLDEYKRFHPQVRYDNLTLNCCRKCKGEIQVI